MDARRPVSRSDGDDSSAVTARALVKRYDALVAVGGIDFRIAPGEVFGFLGPNGAGKTTTMRMIQAAIPPSSGLLSVLGLDVSKRGREIRARIGVVPQEDNLDTDLTVMENLVVYARYFGVPGEEARERARSLLDFVALGEKAGSAVRELSGGMKRRLVIARALVNDPELLILDEPTTGLDPHARHLVWQKLRELGERGITMVLTTHYMDEAERLCDRLVVMDGGTILAEGTPRGLIDHHVGQEVVELRGEGKPAAADLATGLDLSGVRVERAGDDRLFFCPRESEVARCLVERAADADVGYHLRNATLEDVFLTLTGRELSE